jgi:tetratricopeptide (TPR) repeat protein
LKRKLALTAVLTAGGVYYYAVRPERSAAPSGYVSDIAVCAGCHAEIAKTYRLTGMGRSFSRAGRAKPIEDFTTRNTFYHPASDRHYTMSVRGGKPIQRRHQSGYGGVETNVVEVEADFIIGSGNHARGYLHRAPDGRLLELPVTWYTAGGGFWAMSPGYDRPNHKDFRRPIGYNCMFCHNAYPGVGPAEPRFGERIPEGIDCERCHGPGRAHAAAAASGKASREAIRQSIVNPARLPRDRNLEVCMQCHLETTSSRLPNVIARYGTAPFSYRPGEPLGASFLYFDHPPEARRGDKFEIAHDAYRLRQSACFRKSALTCTTCHNPHDVPRGERAVRHYDSACRNCHKTAHPAEKAMQSNCAACHMPKRRAEDAVHVVMTDHYIERRKPAGDPLAPRRESVAEYRGQVAAYYPPEGADDLYLALAQVRDEANLEAGAAALRNAIERRKPSEAGFYLDLAKAYFKAGNLDEAVAWCEEALRRKTPFPDAALQLSAALIAKGDLARAAQILSSASPDGAILANLGNVYLRQSKLDAAEAVLNQALELSPDDPGAYNLLAMTQARKGDAAAAERSFRRAIAAQPDFAEAHHNLANLLAVGRDFAQAAYHFEKALAADPGYAEAHHAYALLLMATRSFDRALRELEKAVRLNPAIAQAHSDLADLLSAKGLAARAAAHYREAVRLNPGLYEAHLELGKILAAQGNRAAARESFENAARSPDPPVRDAARKALQ